MAEASARMPLPRALWTAAQYSRTVEVQQLLADGADVEKRGGMWSSTPLQFAATRPNEAVLKMLLESGADVSARDMRGRTAEDLATSKSHVRIVAMLAEQRRAKCVAFAMGQHERLGAGSWVRGLEVGVVQMVLEQV